MRALVFAVAAAAFGVGGLTADAATIQRLVLKATDVSNNTGDVVDPYLDWVNGGGVNEGVTGATTLSNNGVDYKDSWIDSNWGLVDSVRVSMYRSETEVAWFEFDAAGTTQANFFDLANLTGSTWGTTGFPGQDLIDPYGSGEWFSIGGAVPNDRHWYVNNNWGGCGVDRGWFVVLDGTVSPNYVCGWEDNGTAALGSLSRGFMYSTLSTHQNFNDSTIGIADMFAVTVTYEQNTVVPLPASALLLLSGVGGLAALRRRRGKPAA